MDFKCPECGHGASMVLIGTDERRYAKCLECGEITLAEPPQTPTLPPLNAERGEGDATL